MVIKIKRTSLYTILLSTVCDVSSSASLTTKKMVLFEYTGICVLFQVAWVRVDTQTILSIHHNVITQNPRISLSYNDHRSWYLHIKNVHQADRGWYMCQVNTDPMRSRQGYLQVVGKTILLIIALNRNHLANLFVYTPNHEIVTSCVLRWFTASSTDDALIVW